MSRQQIKAADAYKMLRPSSRKKLKGLVKQIRKNAKNGRTETLKAKLERKA